MGLGKQNRNTLHHTYNTLNTHTHTMKHIYTQTHMPTHTHNLDALREEGTTMEDCLHQIAVWACLWGIFSIANWCMRAPMAGIVLGTWSWVMKRACWADQASQPISVPPPALRQAFASGSCPNFPRWGNGLPENAQWDKFFPPKVLLISVYHRKLEHPVWVWETHKHS